MPTRASPRGVCPVTALDTRRVPAENEPVKRFETRTRVRFAETDAAGIVYYNEFFVYFEVGRIEMFRELGLTYSWRIPIVDTQCTFHAPARFDDLIEIQTFIEHVGTASFRIGHEVYQVAEAGNVLLAAGRVVMVNVAEDRKSTPLPHDMRATLASACMPESVAAPPA